jgi:hypothetical protein
MFNPAFLAWQNSSANLIEPVGPPLLVFLLGVETMPSARHGRHRQLNEKMMTTDLALLHIVNMKDILDVNESGLGLSKESVAKVGFLLLMGGLDNVMRHLGKIPSEIQWKPPRYIFTFSRYSTR